MQTLPFIDLAAQQKTIRTEIDKAIAKVLNHGCYILGPEVAELEQQLQDFCGVKHAITCASGTDALCLILRAKNIGPGDVVFVPSFTFAATAEAVVLLGATPYFVDVLPDTFNIDPKSLLDAIKHCAALNLKARCVIPVDLFGLPADYEQINKIAAENNLWVLADSAQSFGANYKDKKVGTLALATATSFFPAKPLGCYGDGGCIFTDDSELAQIIKSLRVHGQGQDKYDNIRIGLNSRLDTLQAAILIEKLKVFPAELIHRQTVATKYTALLPKLVLTQMIELDYTSAWAQFTLVLPEQIARKDFMARLAAEGIPTMIYYPKPLHLQVAYKKYVMHGQSLPVTENLMERVVSLPMHGYLELGTAEKIGESILKVIAELHQENLELAQA